MVKYMKEGDAMSSLSREEWRLLTVSSGWLVKDVAHHLLGGDVANLSRRYVSISA
jgi:hypothetical protein